MPSWLVKLAIYILLKSKHSVLMNVKVEGDVTLLSLKETHLYDNTIIGNVFFADGSGFDVPPGKFRIRKDLNLSSIQG